MSLNICSLASSSKGNSTLVQSEEATILIDAGISCKQILLRLGELNIEPSNLDGIFITHEHQDHISGLKTLLKRVENLKVFATEETILKIGGIESFIPVSSKETIELKDLKIKSFSLSHDALNPVGYSVISGSSKFSIVTDTGKITEEIFDNISDSDILFLEANYEPEILRISSYPQYLKERIDSEIGHLSNYDTARCIVDMIRVEDKKRQILLSHMSKESNSPDLARITITNFLEEAGVFPNNNLKIGILDREKRSGVFSV